MEDGDIGDSCFTFIDYQQTSKAKTVSSVWYYFLRDVNGKVAKCKDNECNKILKTGDGSTTGLHAHLRSRHKNIYKIFKSSRTGNESGESNLLTTSFITEAVTFPGEDSQQLQTTSTNSNGEDCSKEAAVPESSSVKKGKNSFGIQPTRYIDIAEKRGVTKKSVWYYFLRGEDGHSAKCKSKMCQKIVKARGGSTSGLHAHLKSKHNVNLITKDPVKTEIRVSEEIKQTVSPGRSSIFLKQSPPKINLGEMNCDITTCKDMIWRLSNRVCTLEKEIKELKEYIISKENSTTERVSSSNATRTKKTAPRTIETTVEENEDFMCAVKEEFVDDSCDYESDNGFPHMEMDNSEDVEPSKAQKEESGNSSSEGSDKDDDDYSPTGRKSGRRRKRPSQRQRASNKKKKCLPSVIGGSADSEAQSKKKSTFVVDIEDGESENERADNEENSEAEAENNSDLLMKIFSQRGQTSKQEKVS